MYGLPNHAPLSQVVHELTEAHHHTYGTLSGIEPGLLKLLRDAVSSSSGRGSAPGGGSKASAPVDATALTLWESICGTVDAHWPGRMQLHPEPPVQVKLQQWVAAVAGTENEVHLLEMATWWRRQIRDLLNPPQVIPLRGVACKVCGHSQVSTLDPDGGTVLLPALTAYASENPMRVSCAACETDWCGELAIQLLAH